MRFYYSLRSVVYRRTVAVVAQDDGTLQASLCVANDAGQAGAFSMTQGE